MRGRLPYAILAEHALEAAESERKATGRCRERCRKAQQCNDGSNLADSQNDRHGTNR